MEFLEKPLTNATRRSIIDVAEVLDTPLKLVNTKSLKMNKTYNFKIKSTTKKSSKSNFREVIFRGHNFHASIYPGVTFLGGFFGGGNYAGGFFWRGFSEWIYTRGHFFGNPTQQQQNKFKLKKTSQTFQSLMRDI